MRLPRTVSLAAVLSLSAACGNGPRAHLAPTAETPEAPGPIDRQGEAPPGVDSNNDSDDSDVTFAIDAEAAVHPISPLIYGTNSITRLGSESGLTLARLSGNRFSTYNWENNASNSGTFWQNSNDLWLAADGLEPAAPVHQAIETALGAGATLIVTVPTLGWVAADALGPVSPDEPKTLRFRRSLATGGTEDGYPLHDTPDLADSYVYQDAFVASLAQRYSNAFSGDKPRILFSLDNEPSLWADTFPRAYSDPPRYADVIARNIEYASVIKEVEPRARVLGPVLYGWDALWHFHQAEDRDAPPWRGRPFVEAYLAALRDAEQKAGKRLLDALDIHWYPQVEVQGVPITSASQDPDVVAARLQAPRSLWDPTYVEESWITHLRPYPLRLLPWLQSVIASTYPGTKLVVSEYNFGGGSDVSGALAQADVLGIFGREGVWAASLWELRSNSDHAFIYAGMAMYRNFDRHGGHFGDVSVYATTTDRAVTSIYAALDSERRGRITLVAINKSTAPLRARFRVKGAPAYSFARVYVLTADTGVPEPVEAIPANDNDFIYVLPAMSVSTLVLDP